MAFTFGKRILAAITGRACADFESLISAASDGMASELELVILESHLKSCESCRAFKAVTELSRTTLQSRPRAEVPAELSSRLMNALAAEREAELRKRNRGGGFGIPAGMRLGLIGGGLAAAMSLAIVFSVHHPNAGVSHVAHNPGVHLSPTKVAMLPANHESLAVISKHQNVKPAELASSQVSRPTISGDQRLSNERAYIETNHHAAKPVESVTAPVNIAFVPKPLAHRTHLLPLPGHSGTGSSGTNIAMLPTSHSLSNGMSSQPNSPSSEIPPVIPQPKPVEVASVPNDNLSNTGAIATEPTQSDIQHSHLLGILHNIAHHTQSSGEATIALTSMTGRINYSESIDLVGSAVH